MLLSRSLGTKYQHRGSVISLSKGESGSVNIDPVSIAQETMKALFSCCNCVVVANSLTCSGLLTQLIQLVQAVAQHGPTTSLLLCLAWPGTLHIDYMRVTPHTDLQCALGSAQELLRPAASGQEAGTAVSPGLGSLQCSGDGEYLCGIIDSSDQWDG